MPADEQARRSLEYVRAQYGKPYDWGGDALRKAPPATLDVPVCRALDTHPEVRAATTDDDGPGTLAGHFSRFDEWYRIDSWFEGTFMERTVPGAFTRTIKNRSGETPVRVLLEHGFDPQVGDKPLGVPSVLEERDNGPYAEVPLFDTSYNRDLAPALRGGAYSQSFRFQVLRDEWVEEPERSDSNPDGIPERTIKEVRLIEFGPTVFPANSAADAGLRSTTDQFYEKLRRRDSAAYDDAVARTKTIRTPQGPDSPTPHSEDPPDRHSEDPQPRHSTADSTNTPKEKSTMEPMTVEERAARQDEIRARLTAIDAEFNGAALTDEVESEWTSLNEEYDEHQRAVDDDTRRKERIRSMSDRQPNGGERVGVTTSPAPAVHRKAENIFDLQAIRNQARSLDDVPRLYGEYARRAVEQARFPGTANRGDAQTQVERLLDTVDDADGTLARRILATGSPVYDRAFGKAAVAGSTAGLSPEEQRALSVGTTTEGGFAVPFQLDPTVILTSAGSINPLRQIARVEQIVGKEWDGVTSAGITVSRAAESAESTDNAPALAQPTVKAERVHGFIPFSIEVDQDWTALRSEMTRLLGEAKDDEEAASFVTGTGASPQPNGVVQTLNASSNVTANTFAVASLYALEEALPPRFRARASMLGNRTIFNLVRQFDTAGGSALWVRLGSGLPAELIGYPAYEVSSMSSTPGTIGQRFLLLGDFSKFLIVDRVGMNVELLPHLLGTNRRPTGQRGLYAIWRNNSKILTDNAFRILNKAA